MAMDPFRCPKCENETWTLIASPEVNGILCPVCLDEIRSAIRLGRAPAFSLGAHPKERTVVWENPATGKVAYPGRNDAPMPQRYVDQGFVRKELPTLRSIEKFEKEHKVLSEVAHFDKGSGRGHDDSYRGHKF